MPIIYCRSEAEQYKLIVSENSEPLSHFKDEIGQQLDFQSLHGLKESRQIEILNSHLLIRELLCARPGLQFTKDEHGKPHAVGSEKQMSISHSFSRSCAIVSEHETGIDIQKSVHKIKRIQNKFLSEEELAFIEPENEMEMLHVMWGAKESIYKAYGKKKVTFKTQLEIEAFEYQPLGGIITGHIKKENYAASYNIEYHKLDDYYLVFAIHRPDSL